MLKELIQQAAETYNIPKLQDYVVQLKSDLTNEQNEEFDRALTYALTHNHHFLRSGVKTEAMRNSEPLYSDQILDSLLDYTEAPQGRAYWNDIDDQLWDRRNDETIH